MDKVNKIIRPWSLFLLSFLIISSVLGIYLTYQSAQALSIVDKPPPAEETLAPVNKPVEPVIEPLVEPDPLENTVGSTTNTNAANNEPMDKAVPEKTADKKISAVVPELSARQKPITKVESNPAPVNYDTTLNSYVLDVIKTYPLGRYPYLLNTDYANYNGVSVNLFFQNRLFLKAHPSGNRATHCTGITFEVFFKAMQNRNKKLGLNLDSFNGMSYDQLYDFMLTWYVADGDKRVSNVAAAVEKYGIGKRITRFEDAKAGDFMDISRENNTGHTVVFMNWLRDKSGRIIGFKYWSSQQSTNGINYKEEYFNLFDSKGQKYGNVMINQVYIARISPVAEFKKFQ